MAGPESGNQACVDSFVTNIPARKRLDTAEVSLAFVTRPPGRRIHLMGRKVGNGHADGGGRGVTES